MANSDGSSGGLSQFFINPIDELNQLENIAPPNIQNIAPPNLQQLENVNARNIQIMIHDNGTQR